MEMIVYSCLVAIGRLSHFVLSFLCFMQGDTNHFPSVFLSSRGLRVEGREGRGGRGKRKESECSGLDSVLESS